MVCKMGQAVGNIEISQLLAQALQLLSAFHQQKPSPLDATSGQHLRRQGSCTHPTACTSQPHALTCIARAPKQFQILLQLESIFAAKQLRISIACPPAGAMSRARLIIYCTQAVEHPHLSEMLTCILYQASCWRHASRDSSHLYRYSTQALSNIYPNW